MMIFTLGIWKGKEIRKGIYELHENNAIAVINTN